MYSISIYKYRNEISFFLSFLLVWCFCILVFWRNYFKKKNIDISYLQGDTNADCKYNIVSTVELFTKLGFPPTKSIFSSTQN